MLLGSMAQNAFAQKIEIKGTVRDASDKSIEYVNVCLLYTSPSPRDTR